LSFGVLRRPNPPEGPSLMGGAYPGTLLYVQFGLPSALVAAVVVAGAVVAGVYVERLCFAPFAAGASVASMVSSFAIWMQLEQAMILLLPRHTYAFPALATGTPWEFGPFTLRSDQLLMLALAIANGVIVHPVIYRTGFGTGAPPPGGVVKPQPAANRSEFGMAGWIVIPVGAASSSTGAPPLSMYRLTSTAVIVGDGPEDTCV